MTTTDTMTSPEFITAAAALCGQDEAAVVFITAAEGISYCVASEAMAHTTAQSSAAEPVLDDGDLLLSVGVISADGTLAQYPVQNPGA